MSKKFKSQDYSNYKKLGKRWRKPKGLQSKLRKRKAGSGMKPAIGRKKKIMAMPVLVKSVKDLENLGKDALIVVSNRLGTKKALVILKKSKELGIKVVNKNKIERDDFYIKKRREAKKKTLKEKEEKKKKEEEKAKEATKKKDEKKKEEAKKGEPKKEKPKTEPKKEVAVAEKKEETKPKETADKK